MLREDQGQGTGAEVGCKLGDVRDQRATGHGVEEVLHVNDEEGCSHRCSGLSWLTSINCLGNGRSAGSLCDLNEDGRRSHNYVSWRETWCN